jgi:hypothetical protein
MDPKAMREQMTAHMSPEMLQELEGMFRRLPPVAVQKLQSLSMRAMRGEDVQAEMMQLMHTMPPEFLSHMMSMGMNPAFREAQMQMQNGGGVMANSKDVADAEVVSEEMSVDQAKRVIEAAVKDGTMTREEADALLANS